MEEARGRAGRLGRGGRALGPERVQPGAERLHGGRKSAAVLDETVDLPEEPVRLRTRRGLGELTVNGLDGRTGRIEVERLDREPRGTDRLVERLRVDPELSEVAEQLLGARHLLHDRLGLRPVADGRLFEGLGEPMGLGIMAGPRLGLGFFEVGAELSEVEPKGLELDEGELRMGDRLLAAQQLLLLGARADLLRGPRRLDEVPHVEDLLDLVDLALDLISRAAHRLEHPALLLEKVDQRTRMDREDRRKVPLGPAQRLDRRDQVFLDPERHVRVRQQSADGGGQGIVRDVGEPLLHLLHAARNIGRRSVAELHLRLSEQFGPAAEVALVEQYSDLVECGPGLGGKEAVLARVLPHPVEGRPTVEELLQRLPSELHDRLAQQRAGLVDLGALEVVAGSGDGRLEPLGRESGPVEPGDHLLEGLELVARRVQVLGELLDPFGRLLARGQCLGVDLQSERFSRTVHRREHFARVPSKTAGL